MAKHLLIDMTILDAVILLPPEKALFQVKSDLQKRGLDPGREFDLYYFVEDSKDGDTKILVSQKFISPGWDDGELTIRRFLEDRRKELGG